MPSPASKTKSESRLRRGRSRSRSRSRGRSKSPSRKAKSSPSPSRKVERKTSSPSRRSSRTITQKSEDKKVNVEEEKTVTVTSVTTEQKLSSSATLLLSSSNSEKSEKPITPGTRHSARLAEKLLKQESGEGDSNRVQKKLEHTSASKKQWENGGPIATTFAMLLFTFLTFSSLLVCNKKSCDLSTFKNLHKLVPTKLSDYYDRNAVLAYVGFVAFQAFLSVMPVGRVVEGQPIRGIKQRYRLNGFFGMLVNVALFVTMWRYKCGLSLIYQKFQQLAVTGFVFSMVFSLVLYFKGRNLRPSQRFEGGHTGCIPHDFAIGRELNPRFGSIDVKMFLIRVGIMGYIAVHWSMFLESYERTKELNMPLLMLCVLATLAIADYLAFENYMLTTALVAHDAVGAIFVLLEFCAVPFFYTLPARYLLEHPPKDMNNLWLGFFASLFFIGFLIRRGADSQKFKFRRNPHDESLANLETMPTTGGRRLLVSGWWGLVRHPNYLGELILAIAMALHSGCGHFLPYLPVLLTIMILIDRARMDSRRCRQKHGSAWDRYCQRVKYYMVPYVY